MINVNEIKMVVSDLDGTLVSNGVVSRYTHDVIGKLKANNILFCVATGRQYQDFIFMFTDEKPIGISLNGALVYDSEANKVFSDFIDDESIRKLIEYACLNDFIAGFYIEKGIVSIRNAEMTFAHWIQDEYLAIGKEADQIEKETFFMNDAKEFSSQVLKVEMIVRDPARMKQYINELSEIKEIEIFKTSDLCLEATKKGVDKAKGISELMKYYGIKTNEIIVCGDSGNDLRMLSMFGNSLVPSNGIKEAKCLAKVITDSVYNEGVARYLDTLVSSKGIGV